MTDAQVQRRLAAIVMADLVGYSRLVEADEDGAISSMKLLMSDVVEPELRKYRGKAVRYTGDGFLAIFDSVVDAANCALEVQAAMNQQNSDVPDARRFDFRMGIELGDVIVTGNEYHGRGINIAARLESLAKPGSVYVSGLVRLSLQSSRDYAFDDLGEHKLKNMAEPVSVYRLHVADKNVPSHGAVSQAPWSTIEDKPSIAVLAFDNLGARDEDEHFADGIAEDILSALSKFHWCFVIARNSSFAYRRRPTDAKLIGAELGVRYLLEGSVRRAGGRVRISTQLIEAATGYHVWAERFDKEVEDIFVVQDQITESVIAAVAPEFLAAEMLRAKRKTTPHLDAWELVMRAHWHLAKFDARHSAEAKGYLEKAIALHPSSGFAYSDLALCHVFDVVFGWSESIPDSVRKAAEAAAIAIEIDSRDARAHTALGAVALVSHRHDEAIEEFERAIELNPNEATAYGALGNALAVSGRSAEAIERLDHAIRLSPRDPFIVVALVSKATAAFIVADYQAAIRSAREAIRENASYPGGYRVLAAALALSGEIEQAREVGARLLELMPGLNLAQAETRLHFKDPADKKRFLNGLEKAGLPL